MPHRCRICGSPDYDVVLDFGNVALADSFLPSPDAIGSEERYPLTLVLCQGCMHLQIKEILDPNLLFADYPWETGIPASIGKYCREFADAAMQRAGRAPKVAEIASNDGTMLKEFRSRGCDVVGVDPARNIAAKANAAGIPTVVDYFSGRVAADIASTRGKRDLIIARNVLGHAADLHGLVEGMRLLLAERGTVIIEVPHLLTTFRELQYDQVFHEHVGYHSLDSIVRLLAMHELSVFDVEKVWIHGGSLRVYAAHTSDKRQVTPAVAELLDEERAAGILDRDAWQQFRERAQRQKRLLRERLESFRDDGKMVVGYGASGKGQSMIQFCALDDQLIKYVADKSTMKIGKLTPGSHIPIVSADRMRADPVDVVLLFAWNFADEILEQERALRDRGVRFLHPIPEPHFL